MFLIEREKLRNNNLKSSKDNNKQEKIFASSDILLEMAKDEYSKERERANALDNKASFFITLIVAIATIFVPIIPFGMILPLFGMGTCAQKCIMSMLLSGIIIAFAILTFAFKNLYDSYKLTDYKRPNLACIDIESNHTATREQLNKELCDHYKTVVDDNLEVNEKKCVSITKGLKLCGAGFLLLIVSTVGLIIMIGG